MSSLECETLLKIVFLGMHGSLLQKNWLRSEEGKLQGRHRCMTLRPRRSDFRQFGAPECCLCTHQLHHRCICTTDTRRESHHLLHIGLSPAQRCGHHHQAMVGRVCLVQPSEQPRRSSPFKIMYTCVYYLGYHIKLILTFNFDLQSLITAIRAANLQRHLHYRQHQCRLQGPWPAGPLVSMEIL